MWFFLFYVLIGSNEKISCEVFVYMYIICFVYKSFDMDEVCRVRIVFNLKLELEILNNFFKIVIDR